MNEKLEALLEQKMTELKGQVVTPAQLEEVKAMIAGIDVKDNSKAIKELKAQFEENIRSLEAELKGNTQMEAKGIKDLLIESKALEGLKNKTTQSEFEVKAVGDETTANVVVADTAPKLSVLGVNGQPYQIARTIISNIMDYVDMGTSDKATIVYVDEVAGEGTVGTTNEGVAKNQVDVDYKEVTVNAVKYTGLVKVTEEALDDISYMAGEIRRVLNEKLLVAKSAAVLTDVLAAATTFSLTDFDDKVNDADNVDVIIAAKAQSVLSGFVPQHIVMHPVDIAMLQLAKSTNVPRISTQAGTMMVDGLTIIPSTQITKDNFVLGDFSKFRVRIYKDKLVMGWDADDFSKNKRTIIAETRMLKYISTNEKTSLIKGVFSTIKTALETP